MESALCTTGSPRRWSQRVSRKCYESVGAAKNVIMPLPYQLGKAVPSASKIKKSLNSSRSWNHGLMISIISPENNHANRYRLCTSGWNMWTRLCNSFSDQTNAIPHWLWNQPSAPPVHPEDGVKGCLGNAMKVSEPQKMSSYHSQINLARLYPLKAKSINP